MTWNPYERPWPVCCERYADLVQRRIGRRFMCRVCRRLFHRDPHITYLKREATCDGGGSLSRLT